MPKVMYYSGNGKTTQITEYEDVAEIIRYVEANGQFHDGTVEFVSHNSEGTVIGFKKYDDPEYKFHRIAFEGNVDLTMELDLLVRYIFEIAITTDGRVRVSFDGTGIAVIADHIKLEIQELIS